MDIENSHLRVKAKRKIIYELGKPKIVAIIKNCALCGGRHVHGWRTGLRVAHCANARDNYFLKCSEEATMGGAVRAKVLPILTKLQLWFELKIMLPVLYRINPARDPWW